jgi:protein-S-isoprenylcysteine O-methyltransferase Ste14
MTSTVALAVLLVYHNNLLYEGCRHADKHDFETFSKTVVISRTISNVATLLWYKLVVLEGASLIPSTPLGIWVGLPLIIVGQLLNIAVYYKLGYEGVYYGWEFGVLPEDAERVKGFPFTIPHPMYVGVCLTYVGVFLMWGVSPTYDVNLHALFITALAIALYVRSSIVENKCIRKRQRDS